MSKVRDISNLSNIIKTDASGNVSFVSGSTTLATLNTSGQLSGSSPVLSSSYALNATSASYTLSASNATNAVTASFANAFTVANTLTAQTLVVQTITSSVLYSSGSNVFGNNIANTQVLTGSVTVTGSLAVVTNGTEFQVNASGVKIGNVIGDTHTVTGSVGISGSATFVSSVTASSFSSVNAQFNPYTSAGTTGTPVFQDAVLLGQTANVAKIQYGNSFTNNNGSWLKFTVNSSDTVNTPVDVMTLKYDGSVGIGTSSPAYTLDVYAASGYTARFNGATYGGLILASGSIANTYFVGESTLLSIEHTTAINLRTNNADRVRITSAGNVGIGTSSPSNILELGGATNKDMALVSTSQTSYVSVYDQGMWLSCNRKISNGAFSNASLSSAAIWLNGADGGSSIYFRTIAANNTAPVDRVYLTPAGILYVINGGVDATYQPMIGGMYNGNNNETNLISTAVSSAAGQSGFRFDVSNGAGSAARTTSMTINRSSVSIVGSLSKGSGSFRIKHPLVSKKNTHYLVHSFIEGPQADLIYSGGVTLVDGKATINIDEAATMTEGTFEALNRNIRVFTSNETSWDNVRGKVVGNILTIECQNTESTDEVSWLVIGERQDEHMFETGWTDNNGKVIVEPLIEENK